MPNIITNDDLLAKTFDHFFESHAALHAKVEEIRERVDIDYHVV